MQYSGDATDVAEGQMLPDPNASLNELLQNSLHVNTLTAISFNMPLTHCDFPSSGLLLQKIFCLIHFCGEVWAASSIGVVEKHKLAVLLADNVFCESTLASDP
jgi:hypothetical protein